MLALDSPVNGHAEPIGNWTENYPWKSRICETVVRLDGDGDAT